MTEDNPNVIDLSPGGGGPPSPEGLPNVGVPRPDPMPGVAPGWPPSGIPPRMDHLGNLTAAMEINNHLGGPLSHKDPPVMSGLIYMQPTPPGPVGPELQSQFIHLEEHYRVQANLLSEQFDKQRRLLAEEQIKMQQYFKVMMVQKQQQELIQQQQQQQQMEDQRRESERRDIQKLDQIKHKTRDEESAIASSEVKLKLRECLLNKGQGSKNSPPEFRQWATQHSSLEQHSPPTSGLSPPLRPAHLMGRFQDEYPLRKTVSEPNLKIRPSHRHKIQRNSPLPHRREQKKKHPLATSEPNLKVRLALKQKMIERRSSPLLRRKDRLGLLAAKRTNTPLTIDTMVCNSNPDSGPNSPPTSGQNSAEKPTQKEEPTPPLKMMTNMVINQSMPNISLGQPRDKLPKADPQQSLSQSASEAELRARAAAQYGLPLLGYQYYPMPTAVPEGEMSPTNAAMVEAQMKMLELARSTGTLPPNNAMSASSIPPCLINTMSLPESSQPRIQRPPLHRTHSAPLPLPGQLLWNQHHLLLQKQQEQMLKESQKVYLKQKLQSTLLQRSSSKSQMENVDEAAESRLHADGINSTDKDSEVDVVIIDDHKDDDPAVVVATPRTSLSGATRRERETFLMRQPAISGGSPPITTVIPEKSSEDLASSAAASDMDMLDYSLKGVQEEPRTDTTHATGLVYDPLMLRHECICNDSSIHPENPDRLDRILQHLGTIGLLQQCERIKSRKATPEELKTCHSEAYVHMYSSNPHKLDRQVFEIFFPRFCKLPCGGIGVDSDTVWNELYTPQATRMATGCVIDLAFKVARGDLQNGFALVRPPGHHAEDQQAMGFCFFNSIAVATKLLLDRLQMKRILIVDWDVHHGNSTQQLFYTDPRVLYISLHRHDNGNFFPGTGAPEDCGIDKGVGFNVNIAFTGSLSPAMGDAEYLAAFRTLVMPIAREFNPELVLVSAGFDAAKGHPSPLGGYMVNPACFGYMTKQLMTLAEGKIALVLEGGYIIEPLCQSAEMCLKALLHQEIEAVSEEETHRKPCVAGLETIETTIKCQASYWPCVSKHRKPIGLSHVEALRLDRDEADTMLAFASLSVVPEQSSGDTVGSETGSAAMTTSRSNHLEQPMEES